MIGPEDSTASAPAILSPGRWTTEQQLLHYLAGRDVPCPVCGYNLRALTVPRCPECGRGIILGVRLVEPYLRAWVTLLVTLLASAGLGVFLVAALLSTRGLPGRHSPLTNISMWCLIAAIPLAAVGVLLRRRFLRLPVVVQWLIAGLAVGVWLVVFILFCVQTI